MKVNIDIKKFILFLILCYNLPSIAASNVNFYNINEMYGISLREANSVCKDDDGFIWASSKNGILRLTDDEHRFYSVPYEITNVITVNLIYRHSDLYAYTNNGQIFIYNKISDRFELLINFRKALNSHFLSLNSVELDKNSCLWASTTRGTFTYKNKQLNKIGADSSLLITSITNDNSQLISIQKKYISIINTETYEIKKLLEVAEFPLVEVTKLYMDYALNVLWIGTKSSGLYYYNFDTNKITFLNIKSIPKQPVLAIESITDSTLMLGIDGQGIWEIDIKNTKLLNVYKENADNSSSLRGNGVYDLFYERDKRVWICTYSGGVSYFEIGSPNINHLIHQPNNSNSIINNEINCIIEDSEGRIWMGTNNGICCWDVNQNLWKSFYVNKQEQAQVFLTLCEDDSGNIWAGTYSSGVYVLDMKTGKELIHYSKHENNSSFINDFVFDIYKDIEGDIWIGGINSQVVCYFPKTKTFRKYSTQPLNVIGQLSKNDFLFGCSYGLSISNKETGNNKIIINGCFVQDLLVIDSIVWLCTSGDGLIKFNTKTEKTEKFTTENGLPSNFINSICFSDGYFWIGTENGICRFNPGNNSILTYSSIHLLSGISYNRSSNVKLKNGQLAWGTNNGVVIFDPKLVEPAINDGKIFFQNFSISGRSIRETAEIKLDKPVNKISEVELKYNQNTFSLEFLPIGMPPGSKFSWKLEGLDEEWSQPSNHRIASYSNVKSRNFNLKIRLYDNSLSSIIDQRSISIKVKPPFWSTWYFLVIVICIITLLIYMSLWYYINLLKQKHNEEKIKFFTNTAHDIRTSLTLIKAPVDELSKEKAISEKGSFFLSIAKEQTNRLSSVVTQLMDFQKVDVGKSQISFSNSDIVKLVENSIRTFESLAYGKKITLTLITQQDSIPTAIDVSMIEKVINNLISNAIKYSHPQSEVIVELKSENNNWILNVTDKGIGISKKAQRQLFKEFYRADNAINTKIVGSGIGLLLVKNYVGLHGGNVICTSQENIGSTFQIEIPLKKLKLEGDNIEKDNSLYKEIPQNSNAVILPQINQANQTKKLHVLLVDDNDDLLNFLTHSLNDDFEISVSENGAQAWEIIKDDLPDLVVSDVMMPIMDGFELCQLMKSTFQTSHIPIILLTALTGKTEQMQGMGLGADDYLTKPFNIDLLRQKIKTIIQNRILTREKAEKQINSKSELPILLNEYNDQFVKKIYEVANENLSNVNFNRTFFASQMNVSSSLLYKKVKALTDLSPTDFIKTIRLNKSVELLQTKKYSVTEVSELCGFTSIGYFSTVFKKHFGKSPTDI